MTRSLFPMNPGPGAVSDEWYTPRWVFAALGITFDLDVCAPADGANVPAAARFTIDDDGLTQPWDGVVWCNPPFSRPLEWVRRWVDHPRGIILLRADMNTVATLAAVGAANTMWLPQGRIQFIHPDKATGNCSFSSILLGIGNEASRALHRAAEQAGGVTVGIMA